WRRERDSNPRAPFEANGFQDRRFQPLTHPSILKFSISTPPELIGFRRPLTVGCTYRYSWSGPRGPYPPSVLLTSISRTSAKVSPLLLRGLSEPQDAVEFALGLC